MKNMNPSTEDDIEECERSAETKTEVKTQQRKSLHVQIREKSWFGKKCLKIFKLFTNTFVMTFLAEWGDRSQLATIVMAGKCSSTTSPDYLSFYFSVSIWSICLSTFDLQRYQRCVGRVRRRRSRTFHLHRPCRHLRGSHRQEGFRSGGHRRRRLGLHWLRRCFALHRPL